MPLIGKILVGLIALEHIYILILEMFLWESLGRKVFKGALAKELFTPTKTMAANQGLYNGFLAAGLIWCLCIQTSIWQFYVAVFFLSCVLIAGIYGGLTASKKIFIVQALPALIALIIIHFR